MVQAILDSWSNRGQPVAKVTLAEFERWVDLNGNRDGDEVDTACCSEVIAESYLESISIRQRIVSGSQLFRKQRVLKYTPQEGDDIALYFKLLLGNLPLDRVAHVWSASSKTYKMPQNATRMGFHRAQAPRFREGLGQAPTLWDWQRCVKSFLTEWCPLGKPNLFKWKDAWRGGDWTLSSAEIDGIAYNTTYQYASALMHYEAYTKPLTNPMPSADGAVANTVTYVELSESD